MEKNVAVLSGEYYYLMVSRYFFEAFREWKFILGNKNFKKEFFISILVLGLLLFFFTRFLLFIQARNGVILYDPLLSLFTPLDITWLIFTIIYISLFISIIVLLKSPKRLLTGIQLYIFMIIARMIAMYFMPLEPPASHIELQDPFVEFFGTGEQLSKDLFFSGHTATLFLLFLISEKGIFKLILFFNTILVAFFVILQHVHYSIDVLAAFFFTYACYCLLINIRNKLNQEYA